MSVPTKAPGLEQQAREFFIESMTSGYVDLGRHVPALAALLARLQAEARLAEAKVLKTVLSALEPYVSHSGACSWNDSNPGGDFCTCELRWAKSIIREQRERIAELEKEQP
jgi:hypothetical protein